MKHAVLTGDEHHHIVRVARIKQGDPVTVLDGSGGKYEAVVSRIERDETVLEIRSYRKDENPPGIDMAVAIIRAHRLDYAVEKCAEIGLGRFMPFIAERSVWRGGEREAAHKRERLVRKVIAACKQSGNPYFPIIGEVLDFVGVLDALGRYRAVYLADPAGSHVPSAIEWEPGDEVLGIVGPEGGFSDRERGYLIGAGARPVSLGPRALRSETAAVCLLFSLNELFGSR